MANDEPVLPESPSTGNGKPASSASAGTKKRFSRLKRKLRISRTATPYVVAAVFAALTMGWYFLIFVPQKLDYFVGQRFRTLAVASGQIKGKAESLGQSLGNAPWAAPPAGPNDGGWFTAEYLRMLVPDLQMGEGPRGGSLHLVKRRPPGANAADPTSLPANITWSRVAAQGAAASTTEFDDLVIADAYGEVVWQREKTTPRLGNLQELLYAADDKQTLFSPSWSIRTVVPSAETQKGLPETATLKAVRVGSTSTLMLLQAVNIDSPFLADANQRRLYVAGFVSRSRLQQQAMRIPLVWLVAVSLPVAVLFLALPFIKLATMNAKERFSAANLALMAIGTIAAAALAAVIPVGPRPVSKAGDRVLADMAKMVEDRVATEVQDLIVLANEVVRLDARIPPCPLVLDSSPVACDLWSTSLIGSAAARVPEHDVAIWMDERGEQVRKWTTKGQVTGLAPHRGFEHFNSLKSGTLWSLNQRPAVTVMAPKVRFTIEPLRTPTTSEVGVVFGVPLRDLQPPPAERAALKAPEPHDRAQFLALNVRLRSVVDVVMPPGYGFAVVAPDGRVLFHSSDGLGLEENFFEEVSNAQSVRERMRNERSVTWSGDYHGVPHRIHLKAVDQLAGCPWKIVAFQDLNPGFAAAVKHHEGTFRLSAINLVLVVVAIGLSLWWYGVRHGRDLRDFLTSSRVPDPRRLTLYLLLAVLAVAAIWAAGRPPAYGFVNLLYLFFVALPFLAVGIAIHARRNRACPGRAEADVHSAASPSLLARYELGIVIVLVGLFPAAGFARLVQRVQESEATERWLQVAHQGIVEHIGHARLRAENPAYTEATRARLVVHPHFKAGAQPDEPHFYLAGSPVWPKQFAVACDEESKSGQQLVRSILRWTIFSAEVSGESGVTACDDSNQLQLDAAGVKLAANRFPINPNAGSNDEQRWLPALEWERWAVALLILAGTIAAAYWAKSRAITPRALRPTSLKSVVEAVAPDGNQGIMLIGPPRMRKDQLVKRIVPRSSPFPNLAPTEDPIYRFKLLDAILTPALIAQVKADVSRWAGTPNHVDAQHRIWIHLSNLEAQLVNAERRGAVLDLLEALMERPPGEPSRIIIVTTTIDPVAHFHEIFNKEREDIYDDEIPEVQLSRCSLILSRFRRCYMPIKTRPGADPWWNYDETEWPHALKWEAAAYPPLQEIANAVRRSFKGRSHVTQQELARAFRSQAQAAYDLLWESCTRSEKIVLVQLAQEGFITTRNCEVVWGLINKGLIVERPRPTIFNNSFRLYLRHIERDHVVEQWEREDGNGLWVVAGRLVGAGLIVGGLFFLMTQDFSFDSLLPVISGSGVFGAPVVRALLARVTGRGAELFG